MIGRALCAATLGAVARPPAPLADGPPSHTTGVFVAGSVGLLRAAMLNAGGGGDWHVDFHFGAVGVCPLS